MLTRYEGQIQKMQAELDKASKPEEVARYVRKGVNTCINITIPVDFAP